MIWRNRAAFAAALSLAVLTGSCATTGTPKAKQEKKAAEAGPAAVVVVPDPPRRPGRPVILIAMPDSESFQAVRRTLIEELKKEFDLVTHMMQAGSKVSDLAKVVNTVGPSCVVLMDNPTVKLYREYQQSRRGMPAPPAVVVMASFLEEIRSQMRNTTGVAYEVPGVTAFVHLRSVLARPVSRVGVLHRPGFRNFVKRQTALAAKEQVSVVAVEVPVDPTVPDVKSALKTLRQQGKIDALWILNDNVLLRDGRFLENAWRDEIQALGVPVVVGVPSLVTPAANFGTFAVLPDHDALGVQASIIIFELSETGWRADEKDVELPLSTVTVLNLKQARSQFGLQKEALQRVDRTVE